MKKIFAFILASIMVLSLVPASVFAAISNDDCLETHSIAACDKAGISYSVVKVVAPSCTAGYTIYKCGDCDKQFFGDFVDGTGHKWDIDESDGDDHENRDMSCKNNKTGISWVRCSVCGETGANKCGGDCGDRYCDKGYNETAVKHTPKSTTTGVGCEAIYTCSKCDKQYFIYTENGEEKVSDSLTVAVHEWELKSVVKEPTVSEVGLAAYTCVKCGDTREFNIAFQCNTHSWKRVTNYKAATCTANGTWAEWKCQICGKTDYVSNTESSYSEAVGKTNETGLVSATILEWIEEKGNVIPAYEHVNFNTNEEHPLYGSNNKTNVWLDDDTLAQVSSCVWTQYCSNCGKYVDTTVHTKEQLVPALSTMATCSKPGTNVWMCPDCNTTRTEPVKALGHDLVTIKTPSTCAVQGEIIVICKKGIQCDADLVIRFDEKTQSYTNRYMLDENNTPNNPDDDTVCTIVSITKLPFATGEDAHHVIPVPLDNISNNCTSGIMVYNYCANGCTTYVPNVTTSGAVGHKIVTIEWVTYEAATNTHKLWKYSKCVNANCKYELDKTWTVLAVPTECASQSEVEFYHGYRARVTLPTDPIYAEDRETVIGYKTKYDYPGMGNAETPTANPTTRWYLEGAKYQSIKELTGGGVHSGSVSLETKSAATCTTSGWAIATIPGCCGRSMIVRLPKALHGASGYTSVDMVPAKHNVTGYIAYRVCKDCGAKYTQDTVDTQTTFTVVPTYEKCLNVAFDFATMTGKKTTNAIKDCDGKAIGYYWICTSDHDSSGNTETRNYVIQYIDEPETAGTYTFDITKDYTVTKYQYKAKNSSGTLVEKSGSTYYNLFTKNVLNAKSAHSTKTLLNSVAANCNVDGVAKVYFCNYCHDLFIDAVVDKVDTKIGTNASHTIFKINYPHILESSIAFYTDEITGHKMVRFTSEDAPTTTYFDLTVPKVNHYKYETIGTALTSVVANEENVYTFNWAAATGKVTALESIDFDSRSSTNNPEEGYEGVSYTLEVCQLCDYALMSDYYKAHTHVNRDGDVLRDICSAADVADRYCVVCNRYINITAHNSGNLVNGNVSANCVTEGYSYKYCAKCGWYDITTVNYTPINPYKHADQKDSDLTNYAQVGYKNGYAPCGACGYEGIKDASMNEKGVELMLNTKVNGHEGNIATFGSKIQITVSLGSLNGVNVWGVDFALSYDPNNLIFLPNETVWNNAETGIKGVANDRYSEYLFLNGEASEKKTAEANEGYEEALAAYQTADNLYKAEHEGCALVSTNKCYQKELGSDECDNCAYCNYFKGLIPEEPVYENIYVTYTDELKAGIVHVAATAGASGLDLKGNVELVTLTFQVKAPNIMNAYKFEVGNVFDYDYGVFDSDFDYDYLEEVNDYQITVIDEDGATVPSMMLIVNEDDGLDIEHNEYVIVRGKTAFDVNNDNNISIVDAREMYALLLYNNYNVIADLDADGDVDAVDMKTFYDVLTGKYDEIDLYGEDVLTPEEDENGTSDKLDTTLDAANSAKWFAEFGEYQPTWNNDDGKLLDKIAFYQYLTGKTPPAGVFAK